jgi:uncharacterized protein involved in exopolysaccharide biosynthesis
MVSKLEAGKEDKGDATQADLADLLLVLARHRKWILKITAGAMLLSVIVVLLLPKTYTATATILPPQPTQSSLMTLLGQMGSLAGQGAKELGLKNPSDIYLAMLRSRSVADALISRFNLRAVYQQKKFIDARKKLASRTDIASAKEGTINISVSDRDPKRSAALANGYVEELQNLTRRLALTEAGQRRVFFQKQLDDEKQALAAAELGLRATQERTGLIQLDAQGKAIIEAVAQTRAQIAMREVTLRTMSSFSTDQNPDLIRQKEQLAGLREQLMKLEHTSGLGNGNIQVPTGRVPQVELEFLRCLREVKYHEALFEFLSKQLEAARIDEAKNSVLVQVVDSAVEPERKSGPMRLIPVALLTALTFLGATCWVLFEDRWRGKDRDSDVHQKIQQLRAELRL